MFRGTKIMNRMLLLRGCLSPQEMDTLRSLVVSLLLITDFGKLICSQLHRSTLMGKNLLNSAE